MKAIKKKHLQQKRRTGRIRAKAKATAERPRLSVFRSLKHISGQIIDISGNVIVAASDVHVADKKLRGVKRAEATGLLLAEKAKEKKIKKVVFDKSHYKYHGRVKAFADAVRKGGIEF